MSWRGDGIAQKLTFSLALVSARPYTFGCWFYPINCVGIHGLIMLGNSASTNAIIGLRINTSGGIDARHRDDANAGGTASTANKMKPNAWNFGAAVFTATNSRTAYLNHGAGVVETTNTSTTTTDRTSVGMQECSAPSQFFRGLIARPAIWTVALTASEIKELAGGAHPTTIRPGSLVNGWDLNPGNLTPFAGQRVPTSGGGLFWGPSYSPLLARKRPPPTLLSNVGLVNVSIPVAMAHYRRLRTG